VRDDHTTSYSARCVVARENMASYVTCGSVESGEQRERMFGANGDLAITVANFSGDEIIGNGQGT